MTRTNGLFSVHEGGVATIGGRASLTLLGFNALCCSGLGCNYSIDNIDFLLSFYVNHYAVHMAGRDLN